MARRARASFYVRPYGALPRPHGTGSRPWTRPRWECWARGGKRRSSWAETRVLGWRVVDGVHPGNLLRVRPRAQKPGAMALRYRVDTLRKTRLLAR